MSKIRYYTDEHVSRAVIQGLRQRGVDVLSLPEAGMLGATDEQHLAFAIEQERVIFTQDADFLRMAAAGSVHYGIVYAPQTRTIGDIVRGLMLIYQIISQEEMIGKIEYL